MNKNKSVTILYKGKRHPIRKIGPEKGEIREFKMSVRKWKKMWKRGYAGIRNERYLSIRVGDILHDCDGFNWRVSEIEYFVHKCGRGWFVSDMDAYKENGLTFCTCPSFPMKPLSREEVEEGYTYYYKTGRYEDGNDPAQYAWWNNYKEVCEFLEGGGHIVDENGILLPEWSKKVLAHLG